MKVERDCIYKRDMSHLARVMSVHSKSVAKLRTEVFNTYYFSDTVT
jgi:hypothetical protein